MKETREIIRNPLADAEIQFDPQTAPDSRYPAYRDVQTADGFQLMEYWRAIRKRLWLVIGIAVLITTLTAIYMARRPSIYSAKAVVQVDLEQTNPDLVTADRQRPMLNADPAYFNTQLQLLLSDSLLRRVITEHGLETNPAFQKAKDEANVSPLRSILKAVGLATTPQTPDTGNLNNAYSENTITTPEEMAEAIRLAPIVDALKKNIEIDPRRESRATVKDTRLIDISFRHTDAELAAFIVNSVADTFTTINQEKRSGTSRKTNTFLQERIATLESDIQTEEQKLVNLTETAGILKTENDQTIVLDRLSGLNRQLLEAENLRKTAEANYLEISNSPEKIKALAE
ncbi:MAG: Wzz/FepE/Etk N-terminal domain-containing protein, partial [Pyrinomonadaceae bacterium]